MSVPHSPPRILVVEDNEADVFLVEKSLKDFGILAEVTVCGDGEDALRVLLVDDANALPDAIILDLNLPRVEGVDILKEIFDQPRLVGVPVMIFTSSPSSSDKRRIELLGGTRYVKKPAVLDEFLHVVGSNVKEMLAIARRFRAA